MRGHLEARGKDTRRAKVYLGRGADGRRQYVTRTIHGPKRHAEDVLARLLVECGTGSHDVTDGTFAELALRWFEVSAPGLSPTTARGYERLLRTTLLPRLGSIKVRSLRPQMLDALYSDPDIAAK